MLHWGTLFCARGEFLHGLSRSLDKYNIGAQTTYKRPRNFQPTKSNNPISKDNVVENKPPLSAANHDIEIRKVDWHRDGAWSSYLPTFFSRLRIFNGTFSDESLWKIFLRPFPFILSPMVRVCSHRGHTRIDEPVCGHEYHRRCLYSCAIVFPCY